MGVPKFFRWVAERYPSIILPFKDSPPQVDNLYLDMNGIIHNCTHTNDFDASSKAPSEEEMVQAMYRYLEKLFNAVKPRKYFVMAVDGCAPRAKMNQQRQRRYRSGYEMMVARDEALKLGQELPEEGDVFDSNCITPGTEFMVRMSQHFHYFVQMKLQTDSAWQNCKVVFSGHDHPGEGEHKIVDFIRGRKSQADYDPNETHCMYGLDADLMMLALATHEPRFMLLREVVAFGGGDPSRKAREKRLEDEAKGIVISKQFTNEDEFVLLHVNVLRDYLHLELVDRLVNAYREKFGDNGPETIKLRQFLDFERVLDDFVFMCNFVGNDFLPSIPTVGINDGHLTWLMELYRDEILAKGEYLTEGGANSINWHAVERLFTIIGKQELSVLRSRQEDEDEYQRRAARKDGSEVPAGSVPIESMGEYKESYYRKKLGFEGGFSPTSNDMNDLRLHYVEGLMWVMHYYYKGPASWKWYYPHHYCPLASDLVDLANIAKKVKFDKGEPFLPHQQLLAVLPPMSYRSMPQAYWPLLKSKNSPLKEYFPDTLSIDRDGSRAPWEGIVLIPFIAEEILLAAYDSVQNKLTDEDRLKNRRGKPVLFAYDPTLGNPYTLRSPFFPPVFECRVKKVLADFPNQEKFRAKLCPSYNDSEREGWPSLHSKLIEITPVYEIGAVSNLGQPTRKESLLLQIESSTSGTSFSSNARARGARGALAAPGVAAGHIDLMTSATCANDVRHLVGQEIFVEFPHYKRARVVAVRDRKEQIVARVGDDGQFCGSEVKALSADEALRFKEECGVHRESLKTKRGIWIPEINVLVHVNRFTEMQLARNLRLTRKYTTKETIYPLPICMDIDESEMQPDFRFQERQCTESDLMGSSNTSKGAAGGTSIVYIGKDLGGDIEWFGSVGHVMGSNEVVATSGAKTIAYTVQLKCPTLAGANSGNSIPKSLVDYSTSSNWMSLRDVSEAVNVRALVVSMLCSSITTSPQFGSQEIGLCMKFTGKGLCRVGYCKRVQTVRNPWYIGNQDIFQRMAQDGEDPMHLRNFNPQAGNTSNKRGGGGGKGHFDAKASLSENKSGKGLWYFSDKAVSLIAEFCKRFKPLVQYLEESQVDCNNVDPSAFMTGAWRERTSAEVLTEITDFLKEDGIHDLPMISADDDSFTADHISELEKELVTRFGTGKESEAEEISTEGNFVTKTVRQMNRRYLLFPTINANAGGGASYAMSMSIPTSQKYQLGCRIVNCSTSGSVPFGAKGVVVRLLASGSAAEVVMDLPFPSGSALSGRLKTPRGAILPLKHLLVTHEHGSNLQATANAEAAATNPAASAAMEQPRNVEALMRAAAAAATSRSPLSLGESPLTPSSGGGVNVAQMFPSLARASAVPTADNSSGVASAASTRLAGAGMVGIPVPRTQQEKANAQATAQSVVAVLKRREVEASFPAPSSSSNNKKGAAAAAMSNAPLTKDNLTDVFASMVDAAMSSTLTSSTGAVASSSAPAPKGKTTAVTSRSRKQQAASGSPTSPNAEYIDASNSYLYSLAQKYPQVGSSYITEVANSATSKAGAGYSRERQTLISKGENFVMETPMNQSNVGELMDVMTSVALLKGRQQQGNTATTPPPAAVGSVHKKK